MPMIDPMLMFAGFAGWGDPYGLSGGDDDELDIKPILPKDDDDDEEDFKISQMIDLMVFLNKKTTCMMIGAVMYIFDWDGRFFVDDGYTIAPNKSLINGFYNQLYRQALGLMNRHASRCSIPGIYHLLLNLYEMPAIDEDDLLFPIPSNMN
jgi:hypothetical protein